MTVPAYQRLHVILEAGPDQSIGRDGHLAIVGGDDQKVEQDRQRRSTRAPGFARLSQITAINSKKVPTYTKGPHVLQGDPSCVGAVLPAVLDDDDDQSQDEAADLDLREISEAASKDPAQDE